LKIGITGQNGFIGWHLCQTIKYLYPNDFQLIPFEKTFFENKTELTSFVEQCTVIVHLAGVNKASSEKKVYEENYTLSTSLKGAIETANFKGHLLFASSYQEQGDSLYGKAKKESRVLLEKTINSIGGKFTGLIIPNIYGPFCKSNYNSFVATFCSKIINDEKPEVIQNAEVPLLYVSSLVNKILEAIANPSNSSVLEIQPELQVKVSSVLALLNIFKASYIDNNTIPSLLTSFELQMFNTFRSYLDIENRYPFLLEKHSDERGFFSEIMRTEIGGQFSYSTTLPGITRGNHFHTRKTERFIVIEGKAKISMRKIGSTEVHNYLLDGDEPSYVDMPIWYTHNLTNIGRAPLITAFWINEPYNPDDPDTYFEIV